MRPLLFLFLLFLSLVVLPAEALAETMLSPSYQLRFGNFNMTSGYKSSGTYSLTDTVGQTAAEFFSSAGYSVKAGFQYLYALYDFTFTISDLSIDFGTLTPNVYKTASNILTISAPSQGYSVSAYESHRLQRPGTSYFIADTTCNSGCTQSSAGAWTSTSALGFGYNVSGQDAPADFTDSTFFRPFADLALGDTPEIMMASSSAVKDHAATVTYQVNIDSLQEAGDYETEIIYIATPVY